MTNGEIIEQLENAIELIKQDGKDWLDDRDIPILEACIKSLTALNKIRAGIKEKIEQEEFARSVFRHEEKDTIKAEQCTGSIMAYNNAIKLLDKYTAESGVEK